jgi:transglutaminase-like putative cysteine protease
MKNPYYLLVLLGVVCQGLAWDDYWLPAGYGLAWLLFLGVGARWRVRAPQPAHRDAAQSRATPPLEALVLILGCLAGYLLGKVPGHSSHFFIGHGLAWVQLARLLRPLSPRERLIGILIAVFQVGVACTIILDFRFLLILAAAVWLIPATLYELERLRLPVVRPVRAPLGASTFLLVFLAAVMVFLLFPRAYLGSPFRANLARGGEGGTMLDTILDPARSSGPQSRRILMQVQGEQLGYLRCYALVDFDGSQWKVDQPASWLKWSAAPAGHRVVERQARVKNPAYLARILPTDGRVVGLDGSFFRRAYLNLHGMVETEYLWNRANNTYRYLTDLTPEPEPLPPGAAARFLAHPAPSPKVRQWLAQLTAGATNQLAKARHLEGYLRDHFTYELGAPELNRANALEDFLFQARRGHCERFASALALLLRMEGIPSRVIIGYLPSVQNPISGWYDIRFRDAHSWTEAWLPGHGWVSLDATPRASLPSGDSSWSEFWEALDFAWYAHVVNFDAPTQNAMWSDVAQRVADLPGWVVRHAPAAFATGAVLVFGVGGWVLWRSRRRPPATGSVAEAQVVTARYYAAMLKLLAARGCSKQPSQTPWEFAAETHRLPPEAQEVVRRITSCFCSVRYGQNVLREEDEREMDRGLARLKQSSTGA